MELAIAQRPQTQPTDGAVAHLLPHITERIAYCPGCKALETVWFNNGWLMQTRKFSQRGELVFHDCGTHLPCRLYRSG